MCVYVHACVRVGGSVYVYVGVCEVAVFTDHANDKTSYKNIHAVFVNNYVYCLSLNYEWKEETCRLGG